jgi:three-Cys-motif partner protein
VDEVYARREQTLAKHYILRRYLQALAFKVLRFWDITYIDGFSGPWKSNTEDYSDTSFMIAMEVLKDAQRVIFEQEGVRRKIRCYFSEKDPDAYAQLQQAVAGFHNPAEGFEVKTFCGPFVDTVDDVQAFIGRSFPLIFIDPTGWTGYPFEKVKPLFARPKVEVLINFMYDHVNRFVASEDPEIIAHFDEILGGPGWRERLDPNLRRGPAVEKLFRQTLKAVGGFDFVVSTKIDKSTVDRPHFFIVYGTKNPAGLKVFRDTEYAALKQHAKNRANAEERERSEKMGSDDLFAGVEAEVQEASFEDIVADQKSLASEDLVATITEFGPVHFKQAVVNLQQAYMLREIHIKDICCDLAADGVLQPSWVIGRRKKPQGGTILTLAVRQS